MASRAPFRLVLAVLVRSAFVLVLVGAGLGFSGESADAARGRASAGLAREILALQAAGRIRIADYSELRSADQTDRSLASQQLKDIAAGRRATLSRRCFRTPHAPVRADVRLLRFLVALGLRAHYTLNVLFGQCHVRTSMHYRGMAVDFRCGMATRTADAIGARYGVRRNYETCRSNRHWHYSVGGR